MTASRAIEYRIIRSRTRPARVTRPLRTAERLIAVVAATCMLVVAGSVAPQLVAVGLLAALVVVII